MIYNLNIVRKDIIDGQKIFEDLKSNHFRRITQYRNNYNWLIALDDYIIDKLIGQEINIPNQKVKIQLPLKSNSVCCFKVMYAPTSFPLDRIADHL
jgi:hypothetical protein